MNRPLACFLILLLLMPLAPLTLASQEGFEAGFGPSLLVPLTQRSPLFQPGDELWVGNPSSIPVRVSLGRIYANGSPSPEPVAEAALPARSIALLYRFGEGDVGSWYLQFVNASQGVREAYVLSVIAPPPAPGLAVGDLRLNGTNLLVGLNLTGGLLYDMALALCQGAPGPLRVPLPAPLGNASIELYPENGSAALKGTPSSPFTFWAELYYPYSYDEGGRLLTTLGLALRVGPSYLQGPGGFRLPSSPEASPRQGRYVLRAFFQVQGSTLMQEAMAVRAGLGSWLSAPSCSFEPFSGAPSFVVDLRRPAEEWPRHLYLLYRALGEGLASLDLALPVAKALFASSPWGVPLGAPYSMRASGPGLLSYYYDEGVLYALASSFPLRLDLQLYLASPQGGGLLAWSGQLSFSSAGEVQRVNITLARLDIISQLGAEASLSVAKGTSSFASSISQGGVLTLYLPEGDYNISAAVGGLLISRQVHLKLGQGETVTLSPPRGAPSAEDLAPWAVLAAGLLLNVPIWRRAIRALRLARALSFKAARADLAPWPPWL